MKVLLINPPFPDTFWGYRHLPPMMKKKAVAPPLGLLTIASLLPGEWTKKLIDMEVKPLNDVDIIDADMVFITGMYIQKNEILSVISHCKLLNKTVVCGGWAFNTNPEDFKDADYLILDEAEITLPEFINDLTKGTTKPLYRTHLKPDLAITPVPEWNLINIKDYHEMQIQFSRGCPHKCDFCNVSSFNGNLMRVKTPNQVVVELQAIYDRGWRGTVFVVDDNASGNISLFKGILEEIVVWQKAKNYPFRFYVQASVNCGKNPKMVELMKDANFYCVFLGVETPHLPSLLECNKTQNTLIDINVIIERFQKNGIMVITGIIVGFDNDPEDIAQRQIEFMNDNSIVLASISKLEAKPNTELWRRLIREKRLNENPFDGFQTNFITKMGNDVVEKRCKQISSEAYVSWKNYYKRVNQLLEILIPVNSHKTDYNYMARGIISVVFFSSSRFYFVKTLMTTLLFRNKSLFLLIELAVKGVHFKKFTQKNAL